MKRFKLEEEAEGLILDTERCIGFLKDAEGLRARMLINATGLNENKHPIKFKKINVDKLAEYVKTHLPKERKKLLVRIGCSYFNIQKILFVLKETGNENIKVYQTPQSYPIAIKTEKATVFLAADVDATEGFPYTKKMAALIPQLSSF